MHLDMYLLSQSKSSQVSNEDQHLRMVGSGQRGKQLSHSDYSCDMADKKEREKLGSMSIILPLLPGHVGTQTGEFSKAS